MSARKPRILASGIAWDHHHGVGIPIVLGGIRGEPLETYWVDPREALEIGQSLIRSAKQSMPKSSREGKE